MKNAAPLALLVCLALGIAAIPLALAQEASHPGKGLGRPDDRAGEHKGGAEAQDADDHRGKEGARSDDGEQGPRKAGRIVVTNGSYNGRYVDFDLDRINCTITAFRVYNQTFFDEIRLPAPCDDPEKGNQVRGAQVSLRSANSTLKVHDAPNGLVRFESDDNASVHIDLGAGVVANATAKGFELTIGNLTGLLRTDDGEGSRVDFENQTGGDVRGEGRFWIHPRAAASKDHKDIDDAAKDGRLAGEVDVLVDNGTVSTQVLEYGDVIIKAGKKDDSTYRFLVDANVTGGRTIVVNIGPGVFRHDRIGVQYYDLDNTSVQTPVAITEADDLQDVLNIAPGEGPEYWIIHDEAGRHVLVAVPHFSAHAFEVMSLGGTVAPIIVGGVLAATALVALAAVGVFRRPRA